MLDALVVEVPDHGSNGEGSRQSSRKGAKTQREPRGSSPTVREGSSEWGEEADETSALPAKEIKLAIVGRPNVGKSSLLNRILGEERAIVSPVAGTTRDSVDTLLETPGQTFRIIDTAGIRRKGKTLAMAEKLSVVMARRSMERADVAIVLLDAEQGVAALDAAIAGYAVEAGCSIILALNKWDALENKKTGTPAAFERKVREQMKFLSWAPVITISALKGQRVEKLLPLVAKAHRARRGRIPTSRLNEFFQREIGQKSGITPAKTYKGARLHVQYLTQIGVRPPTFVVFTAGGQAGLHFSFLRHLENCLREEFDLFASPIRIVERHKTKPRGGIKTGSGHRHKSYHRESKT
jgi:GTP-binding protein